MTSSLLVYRAVGVLGGEVRGVRGDASRNATGSEVRAQEHQPKRHPPALRNERVLPA